jgi:hypothetical protein
MSVLGTAVANFLIGVTIFPASTTGPSAINNLIFLASSLF